jgi:hypothetical protein
MPQGSRFFGRGPPRASALSPDIFLDSDRRKSRFASQSGPIGLLPSLEGKSFKNLFRLRRNKAKWVSGVVSLWWGRLRAVRKIGELSRELEKNSPGGSKGGSSFQRWKEDDETANAGRCWYLDDERASLRKASRSARRASPASGER